MNNVRRKALAKIREKIEDVIAEFEPIKEEDDEAFSNIPDNLQETERYEMAQTANDALNELMDALENALESIETAVEQ